jgi:hypothetical protein
VSIHSVLKSLNKSACVNIFGRKRIKHNTVIAHPGVNPHPGANLTLAACDPGVTAYSTAVMLLPQAEHLGGRKLAYQLQYNLTNEPPPASVGEEEAAPAVAEACGEKQ